MIANTKTLVNKNLGSSTLLPARGKVGARATSSLAAHFALRNTASNFAEKKGSPSEDMPEGGEKDNAQSSQSFAQNLEEKIKEAETKLDKLVNAFLDGSIEKETYLVKKDELIKTKTDLNKRKSDFGRKGNNWIEPLRNWIKTAHHAEKLALPNDFYEIKSLAEKIGTNRRLLSRKTEFEFVRLYDLIPKYTEKCERSPAGVYPARRCGSGSRFPIFPPPPNFVPTKLARRSIIFLIRPTQPL